MKNWNKLFTEKIRYCKQVPLGIFLFYGYVFLSSKGGQLLNFILLPDFFQCLFFPYTAPKKKSEREENVGDVLLQR